MPDARFHRSAAVLAHDEQSAVGAGAGPVQQMEQTEQMERIAFALHEMCQPLMTLQCRLEIGKMVGTADGYEEAVKESLVECGRLLLSVDVLRREILRGIEAEKMS